MDSAKINPDNFLKSFISYIAFLFGVGILLYVVTVQSPIQKIFQDEQEIKSEFNQGKAYICQTSKSNKYLIEKKSGWNVRGESFIKDSLMFEFIDCEQE